MGFANCPKTLRPWIGKIYVTIPPWEERVIQIAVAKEIVEYRGLYSRDAKCRAIAKQNLDKLNEHGWNVFLDSHNAISLALEETREIQENVPTTYIDATQICNEAGMRWADYSKLNSTRKHFRELSEDLGVPMRTLIFEKPTEGGKKTIWVHPMVAINLNAWAFPREKVAPVKKSSGGKTPKGVTVHRWEGFPISQAIADFTINSVLIPRDYVNATEMCRANGRLWADYKRQSGVMGYWQALANDMGIPISSLILEIRGYADDQATWVHPFIATDLAQWVSYPFRIWANKTLVVQMIALRQKTATQQEVLTKLLPASPKPPELKFDPEFIEVATKCLNYRGGWNSNAMRNFLSLAIHQHVVKKEGYERLNEINPPTKADGRRDRLQSQHFSEEVDLMFTKRINSVLSVLKSSTSRENFWRNLNNHDSKIVQMTLGDILC